MEIKIIDQNVSQLNSELNKMFWRFYIRKNLLRVAAMFALGFLLFIFVYLQTSGSNIPTNYISRFWQDIGLAIIISSLYLFYLFYKVKGRLNESLEQINKKLKSTNNTFAIIINENYIRYEDPLLLREEKWNMFVSYYFYRANQTKKEYLLLFRYDNTILAIEKKEISESDYNQLLNFVRKKLPLKSL